MIRRLLLFVLVAFVAGLAPAAAQTTNTLAWDYAAPLTTVSTYAQTVAVDGTTVGTVPSCAAKVGDATSTTCQLAIPALTAGTHTISVLANVNGQTAETRVTGFNPTNAPKNPTNERITVVVTVTLP